MRNQFITALQDHCLTRSSTENTDIRWWFSTLRLKARRLGAEFHDEGTHPFALDPHTPTVEDPPVSAKSWARLKVG